MYSFLAEEAEECRATFAEEGMGEGAATNLLQLNAQAVGWAGL